MDIREVLESVRNGRMDIGEAERLLRMDNLDTIGNDVLFDESRQMRKNIPEVVYGATKTFRTIADILKKREGKLTLVSKVDEDIPGRARSRSARS